MQIYFFTISALANLAASCAISETLSQFIKGCVSTVIISFFFERNGINFFHGHICLQLLQRTYGKTDRLS